MIVRERSISGPVMTTGSPVAGSRYKLPVIPGTAERIASELAGLAKLSPAGAALAA